MFIHEYTDRTRSRYSYFTRFSSQIGIPTRSSIYLRIEKKARRVILPNTPKLPSRLPFHYWQITYTSSFILYAVEFILYSYRGSGIVGSRSDR